MGRVNEAWRRAAESAHGTGLPAGAFDTVSPARPDHAPDDSPVRDPRFDPPLLRPAEPPAAPPRLRAHAETKNVLDADMPAEGREQYRRLAGALHRTQEARGTRVVMITSAVAGEGKTLTACNLALTLSESYRRRVLLIDADLRRPALHEWFQLSGVEGLTDRLTNDRDDALPLHAVTATLSVLPGGSGAAEPMAVLTSSRMRRLLQEARQAFDFVIVDTPPVGLMPDANLLASMVDGIVLVIKAEDTPYDLVRRVTDSVGPSDKLMGVVLNQASMIPQRSYYGHGYPVAPGRPAEDAL